MECGPGTVLKNGVCELDTTCGPGTVLRDGVCVLDPDAEPATVQPTPSATVQPTTPAQSPGGELIYGLVAAFIIAGGVGAAIGLMSKASKRRSNKA